MEQLEPMLPGWGTYLWPLSRAFNVAFDAFCVWVPLEHSSNKKAR